MSEKDLIENGSPTLAGIKTGSLMSCPYVSRTDIMSEIREFNDQLVPRGLCLYPLRFRNGRVLVYLFRPAFLQRDLQKEEVIHLLKRSGYEKTDYAFCMKELMRRLCAEQSFPHEIGLFLSYPPEDVKGFMENRAQNYKCVGTWKVYGDEEAAKARFASFRKCTDIYCREWEKGTKLPKLAVKI